VRAQQANCPFRPNEKSPRARTPRARGCRTAADQPEWDSARQQVISPAPYDPSRSLTRHLWAAVELRRVGRPLLPLLQ
jgi:hypothetical protein